MKKRKGTPASDPRERLFRIGPSALSPPELLGILLRDGSNDREALELGRRILDRFGSVRDTARRTPAELMEIPGIGPVRAARVKATFGLLTVWSAETLPRGKRIRTCRDVVERFEPLLKDRKREVFYSVLLDGKNRVLREDHVSMGSLTASIVHPREVFTTAIRESADAVVFVHNHPSGDPEPSAEDIEITNRLVTVGHLVGIRVLDHIIVGDGSYSSFHEKGLLHGDGTRPFPDL